jgi:hypothetical protein
MKHLSSVALWARFLVLPTNIKLDWKSLPGTKIIILGTFLNYNCKELLTLGLVNFYFIFILLIISKNNLKVTISVKVTLIPHKLVDFALL